MTTVISNGGTGNTAIFGGDMNTVVPVGTFLTGSTTTSGTISTTHSSTLAFGGFDIEDFLDCHCFNKITVEHKVAEFELAKLKETVPTYADEIKENLSKNLARDIIKKTTFTKKHNVDSDTHHFLGRVWVFTEDELKNLIQEARNA
jgi:hypothetical protein